MINEITFRFDELVIDYHEITTVLGFGDGMIPMPFDHYLDIALNTANNLDDIKAAYGIITNVIVDEYTMTVKADRQEFKVGKTICHELKGTEELAIFACTAGKTFSEKSSQELAGEDPILGYVYDVLGSVMVEAVGHKIQSLLRDRIENKDNGITTIYSPGYCQWDVSEQHKLFSFFDENICGITLNDSALMSPIKSMSGIIGIGKEVQFRKESCSICSSKRCMYRKAKKMDFKFS
jgi:hypothetical protein